MKKRFALCGITALVIAAIAACDNPVNPFLEKLYDPGKTDTPVNTDTPAHVHQWGNWTQTTAPTCTTAGEETRTCTLDAAHTETQAIAIDPAAHLWGEWVVVTAPMATINGKETKTCKYNDNHTEDRIIPATGIKVNPAVTWPQGLTATYGQILFDIPLASYINNGGTSGAFSWTSPFDSVGALGAQSHNMIFIPTDTADYNTLTQNVVITVNKINIADVELTITGPVKGATPVTTAETDDINYTCGAVSWNPNNNPFLGGMVYTATVTLTADSNYTFTHLSSATVNGLNADVSNNTGAAVTLSHTFAATDTRTATNIVIKTQPADLVYTHGDPLNLTGLVVTLTFDDTMTGEDEAAADFAAKNITANPAHGIHLIRSIHNNQPVVITYGDLPPLTTNNLTVNKAPGVFGAHAAINTTYTPALTLGNITLPASYAWNAPATSLSAGNGQSFAATYTDPSGNYEAATGTITVNVAKAIGAAVSAPTLNTNTHNSITINSVTASTGQSVEYAIHSTNAAPSTGWQAGTTFGGLNAGTTYYFFARSVGNSNYETGAPSTGTAIATKQQAEADTFINCWVDDTGELSIGNGGQGNVVTVQYGDSITFTADGAGYSNQSWTLNGNIVGNGVSYTFDTTEEEHEKEVGRNFIIGLTVQKDGKFYFTPIIITVAGQLFTVTFNANGGSGAVPDAQTVPANYNITLPGQGSLARTGYTFGGWNTNTVGTGTNYSAGSSYTPTDNITLYAKWTPIPPPTRTVTIAMWDYGSSGTGDGWDNNAALRINVNGTNRASNASVSTTAANNTPSGQISTNTYTFDVATGDVVQIYWLNGGQYDRECAFAVYYSDDPPNPMFNPSSGTTGGKVLVSKRYNNPSAAVGNGTLMGSFTVQ